MIWNTVMEHVLDTIRTQVPLPLRMAGTGDQRVPGIEWTLTGDMENEIWAPMTIQLDIWTLNALANRRIERALRQFLHHDVPIIVDTFQFWTQYNSGVSTSTPGRNGFVGRSLRFTLTPLRHRYASPNTIVPEFSSTPTFPADEDGELMWERVMKRVLAVINADVVLQEIYDGHVRMMGSGTLQVPGLEWLLVSDVEEELWAPIIVQFDQWTPTASLVRASEFRLRALFHCELPIVLGGDMVMWSQYSDGSQLATPDRAGFVGRASRFQFTPLRRQYAFPVPVIVSTGLVFGSAIFGEDLFGHDLFN